MNMTKIDSIKALELLDSRGNPTVGCTVTLSNGAKGTAYSPSGASTGQYEAYELRDGDTNRYQGKGVRNAVSNVNSILNDALSGTEWSDFWKFDQSLVALDKTGNKAEIGANAILAVSLATAKAFAEASHIQLWEFLSQQDGMQPQLPVPMLNILNGGRHASNSTDIQEFMIIPVGFDKFHESLRAGVEIYQSLRYILGESGHNLNVGDEGGFAPQLGSNEEALNLIMQAIERSGYSAGDQIMLALDVAASELYDKETNLYVLDRQGITVGSDDLINIYETWIKKYPIISIEDGLNEDDWDGWIALNYRLGQDVQLVGDDLLVTNIDRINIASGTNACNSILLKPNQIGSMSETREALTLAKSNDWTTVMSHRSGETEDATIADLAVGWSAGQIKTGAPARSDRVAKYNRLLQIEDQLGDGAVFAGKKVFSNFMQ
tara:strand:+ start:2251 stop:3555 length:1305 start_codon:yes stop_codon:yes gene_type:complete